MTGIGLNPNGRKSSRGFTLVELLVVIAIITMLMGMLAPVYTRARSQARQITCLSNCKQIAMALDMYAMSYDDHLPRSYENGSYWFQRLHSYVKNRMLFHCSDAKYDKNVVSYSINANMDGTSRNIVGDPSSVIWLADSIEDDTVVTTTTTPNYFTAVAPSFAALPDPLLKDVGQVAYRHNDGAIFTYLDGHSKWHPKEMMRLPDAEKYWKGEQTTP